MIIALLLCFPFGLLIILALCKAAASSGNPFTQPHPIDCISNGPNHRKGRAPTAAGSQGVEAGGFSNLLLINRGVKRI